MYIIQFRYSTVIYIYIYSTLIIPNDLITLYIYILYVIIILLAHHIFCIHTLRCAWMEWSQQKKPACYHWTCETGTIYGLAVSGHWPPTFLFGVLFFSASFVSFLEAKVCSGLARLNRSMTCVTQRWDPGPLRGRSLLFDHLDKNSEADLAVVVLEVSNIS